MKTIAFILPDFSAWEGGKNYFKSVFDDIESNDHPEYRYVVFLSREASFEFREYKGIKFVPTRILSSHIIVKLVRGALNRLVARNILFFIYFKKYRVDLLSHEQVAYDKCVKSLPWIADVQHKYYPELFAGSEVARRNALFQKFVQADDFLVSSQSALTDLIESFHCKGRGHVYHFLSQKPSFKGSEDSEVDFDNLLKKHTIPSSFVFLPNQFWVHKNHRVVFRAMAEMKLNDPDCVLVCTGSFSDYRNPQYKSDLMKLVVDLGIQDNVRFLGKVSRIEYFKLLKQSAVVINPSLFEGWSTTVEEAKRFSKPLVLSDLSVHREQVVGYNGALLFDANNPQECKEAILSGLSLTEPLEYRYGQDHKSITEIYSQILLTNGCEQVS